MTPFPWSISALDKFVTCPKAYHEIRVVKRIVEPEGEAAAWGNRVHKDIEDDLKGTRPLAPEMAQFRQYVDTIKGRPGTMLVEQNMALNRSLQPVTWFAKDVWVRGKADVVHLNGNTAVGLDHKTGKRKTTRQMALMALLTFYHHPQIERVRTLFCWLKTNEFDKDEFKREEIPSLWQRFVPDLNQYRKAFHTDTWQPRQSGLCHGWCPVKDCEYWRPKRVRDRP